MLQLWSYITAGWRQTYHSENLEKTIPTKVSTVLDTYGYAKLAGTKKFGCLPSSLAARGVFVPSKSRLSKSAIFYPKKWFFGNSDTTFTSTKFSTFLKASCYIYSIFLPWRNDWRMKRKYLNNIFRNWKKMLCNQYLLIIITSAQIKEWLNVAMVYRITKKIRKATSKVDE